MNGINILKNGIISNILILIVTYIFVVTLFAPFGICTLNILKGVSIGIYISTLFNIFNFGHGLLAFFLIVLLPNLIYIPSYIYICTNSINLHYLIVDKIQKEKLFKELIKESYRTIIAFSLIVFSVIIEQFAAFGVIHIYSLIG